MIFNLKLLQATKTEPEEHTITTVENPAAIIAPPPVIPEEVTMTIEKPLMKVVFYKCFVLFFDFNLLTSRALGNVNFLLADYIFPYILLKVCLISS